MECVRDLFMRYGLRSVTMDDIARELGVSKKTLYVHFRDKKEMVGQILNQKINSHKEEISAILEKKHNAIEENFEIMHKVGYDLAMIQPTVFFDLKKYYPEAWKIYNDFKNNFIMEVARENLERGVKEGLYRDDINMEILAINYTNMMNMIFDLEIYPYKEYDFRTVYIEIFKYHIRGVASKKGLAYLEKRIEEQQTQQQ